MKTSVICAIALLLTGCGGYGWNKPVNINPLGLLPITGCVLCRNDGSATYSYDKTKLRRGVVVESLNRSRTVYPVYPVGR